MTGYHFTERQPLIVGRVAEGVPDCTVLRDDSGVKVSLIVKRKIRGDDFPWVAGQDISIGPSWVPAPPKEPLSIEQVAGKDVVLRGGDGAHSKLKGKACTGHIDDRTWTANFLLKVTE